MKRILLFALLACSLSASELVAQTSVDPWITKAYSELYKRTPNAEESKIANYNNGSWNSYPELLSYIVAYNNNKGGSHIKGDPWIFRAYYENYNRIPIPWELNIRNYNNGSWNNYDELKKFITEYQNALVVNRLQVVMATVKSVAKLAETAAVFILDGKPVAANLIGNDAGSLKAVGGNELKAKGITALIDMNGATLISDDGSTLKNLKGVQFSGYGLMSEEGAKKIRTAGKTTLVIN